MTKRPVHINYAECLDAILADYVSIYPEDALEAKRDSKRISLQFAKRGLSFFTIDLPNLCKVFDRALASGNLYFEGEAHSAPRFRGTTSPRLFWGLWNRCFDEHGQIRGSIDPNAVFLLRTLLCVFKKLKIEAGASARFKTLQEFFDVENSLPAVPPGWDSGNGQWLDRRASGLVDRFAPLNHGLFSGSQSAEQMGLISCLASVQRVADRVVSSFGSFDPEDIRPKHGPGAVSEKPTLGYKYNFPSWSPNLDAVFAYDAFGIPNVSQLLDGSDDDVPARLLEHHSSLFAVLKTQKGPRLIASEPVANQFVQQGVAGLLRRRVAASILGRCIDFFDQRPSQEAALRGSTDGSNATIDLSSASDRLSCVVVDNIFRSNYDLRNMLIATRTRFLSNRLDSRNDSLVLLRKFATMGSALTFPVQSIVFAIIALGVGSTFHPKMPMRRLAEKVRVFGDDIIVPKHWVGRLYDVLHAVGLKVNESKSYSTGFFRESCGVDAYKGYDVTPCYVRTPSFALDSRSAIGFLESSNNAFLKGLWKFSDYLTQTLRSTGFRPPVVSLRARAYGLASYCGLDPTTPKRWNRNLHFEEAVVYRLLPVNNRRDPYEGVQRLLDNFVTANRRSDTVSERYRSSYAVRATGRDDDPTTSGKPRHDGSFILEELVKFSARPGFLGLLTSEYQDVVYGFTGVSQSNRDAGPAVVRRVGVPWAELAVS